MVWAISGDIDFSLFLLLIDIVTVPIISGITSSLQLILPTGLPINNTAPTEVVPILSSILSNLPTLTTDTPLPIQTNGSLVSSLASSLTTPTGLPTSKDSSTISIPTLVPTISTPASTSKKESATETEKSKALPEETSTKASTLPATTLTTLTTPVTSKTIQWFPSDLSMAPPITSTTVVTAASGDPTTSTTIAVVTGIPTNLPKVITPAEGIPAPPVDCTLVRFGFMHEYNYPFVVSNPVAVAQIFDFFPKGLAYALGIPVSDVIMLNLQPYDTTKNKGWITTLVLVFVPTDLVDQLDLMRHTPASLFFNSPQEPVAQMMKLLDASIPLRAGGDSAGSTGNGGAWSAPGGSNGVSADNGDGAPMGAVPSESNTVSGKTIGLSAGIVAGAAVYGAAMFLVARRYRQKRNGRHSRSNSINRSVSPGSNPASGLMGSGAAVMHGARGPFDKRGSGGRVSARTQQISAPMMAENSLGWN